MNVYINDIKSMYISFRFRNVISALDFVRVEISSACLANDFEIFCVCGELVESWWLVELVASLVLCPMDMSPG